jgi:hypothetical protein
LLKVSLKFYFYASKAHSSNGFLRCFVILSKLIEDLYLEMDLIKEIDKTISNPSKTGRLDLPLLSYKIVHSTDIPNIDEIKKLNNIIEKIEDNEELEWLYIVQILNYLEEIKFEPDVSLIIPLITYSFKRIKVRTKISNLIFFLDYFRQKTSY